MKTFLIQVSIVTMVMLCNACLFNTDPASEPEGKISEASGVVYYISGDYGEAGELRAVSMDSFQLSQKLVEVDQDSRVFSNSADVYVLERESGNILKYNTLTHSVVYQQKLAEAANPYDMVFVNATKGYIAYYGLPYVVEVNLETGVAVDSIDLSAYTVAGELTPNAADLELAGTTLYVTMQRFNTSNGWVPDTAKIAVVNTTTNSIEKTITPAAKNPANICIQKGKLYIAGSGKYGSTDGVVEVIDLASDSSKILFNNQQLGGNPATMGTALVAKDDGRFYVAVSAGWPSTYVKLINVAELTVEKTVEGASEIGGGIYYTQQFDLLVLGEKKTSASGVLFYHGDTLTKGPVGTTINSPNSITVVFPQ